MKIKGLQKTTLLDYPGHVACTVFTGGCNFCCPFCHNASLAVRAIEMPELSEDEFFNFLSKRRGILDGVCITGGEPLLQKDIIPFIERIHSLGFLVKLDTNGSYPEKLKEIISKGIVDYIAMDIKNSSKKYALTAGVDANLKEIFESINIIMNSGIHYEFRTTVVKELHAVDDIKEIAKLIQGAERYFLQNFNDSGDLICDGLSSHDEDTLRKMCDAAAPFVNVCKIRGI